MPSRIRKTASCAADVREAAARGEDRVDEHARHQRARAAVAIGDDAEGQAAGGGGEEHRPSRSRRRSAVVMPEVRDDRREQQRVEHHVERVEHPAERRGDERALRVRRAVAPPREEPPLPIAAHGVERATSCIAAIAERHDADGDAARARARRAAAASARPRRAYRRARRACRRGAPAPNRRSPSHGRRVTMRERALHDRVGIVDDGRRRGARRERAVRAHRRDRRILRPRRAGRGLAGREAARDPGRPKRTSAGSTARTARGDRVGQRPIARRHVVERAVRLDVRERDAFGAARSPPARRSGRAPGLRPPRRCPFISRRPNPTRSGKAGMRADRHAGVARQPDRRAHDRRIAGVRAARDVRRRDVRMTSASAPIR